MNEPMYLDRSFTELVEGETELAEIRHTYASRSRKERAQAADWNYHAAMASGLFSQALARAGQKGIGSTDWPEGYVALAIDPDYAPALLTVASIEYQLKRVAEAMKLFFRLLRLPKETEDLTIIIDKAGDFLIAEEDLPNGRAFYAVAARGFSWTLRADVPLLEGGGGLGFAGTIRLDAPGIMGFSRGHPSPCRQLQRRSP